MQNQLQVNIETINHAAREILGEDHRSVFPWKRSAIAASVMVLASAVYFFTDPQLPDESIASQRMDQGKSGLTSSTATIDGDKPNRISGISLPTQTKPTRITVLVHKNKGTNTDYAQLDLLQGYTTQNDAFAALFLLWGTDVVLAPESEACSIAPHSGLQCLSKLSSLTGIESLNRPVIVNLATRDRKTLFLVTEIDDQRVKLTANRETYTVTRLDFVNAWDGYYTLLWRIPPAYDHPTALGDEGAAVDWLSSQMASIELGDQPLSIGRIFDEELESQVKQFQISIGLVPNGIAGALTWIHINSVEGLGIPMIRQNGRQG